VGLPENKTKTPNSVKTKETRPNELNHLKLLLGPPESNKGELGKHLNSEKRRGIRQVETDELGLQAKAMGKRIYLFTMPF
jgi:hypothetical protein